MKVVAVNIGKKEKLIYKNEEIVTGILKYPVNTFITLGIEDVVNDVVVDRRYHGGENQAVYAYSENHYNYWKALFPNLDWHFGMFGENLTISNLDEVDINVGNVYDLGEAIIEVTKPRTPCKKLGIVFKTQHFLKQFWNTTKSGIYFKVLKTGKVKEGDKLRLIKQVEKSPSIAEVYQSKKNK